MNKAIPIIAVVVLGAVGAYFLIPDKEPTAKDKLMEAGENLAEAANLTEQAIGEKFEEVEAGLEEVVENAKSSAARFADELRISAKENALDVSRLREDLKREFDEGGALNADGYNPERAKAVLKDVGLSEKMAQNLAHWLGELYLAPENADEAIAEFLDILE